LSARYFCIDCWQTAGGAERARPPAAQAATPPPEPQPIEEAAPFEEAPPPAARRAVPPAGLHWIEDPNPRARPAPPALARVAVAAPAAKVAAAAAPAAATPTGTVRRKWESLVETLLGEDESAAEEEAPGGTASCSCGATLGPESLVDGKPALLGFSGGPGAGQTLLLAAMLHQLELAEQPGGQPRLALQGLGDSDEVFRGLRRDLFRHGKKPAAAEARSFGWRVKLARSGEGRRPQPLRGGVAQLVGVRGKADGDRARRHDELLNTVVFLVDGAVLAADLQLEAGDAWSGPAASGDLGAGDLRRFSALCAGLGPRARDVSLAIVVTKADLLVGSDKFSGLAPGGELEPAERQRKIAGLLQEAWRGSIWEEAGERFRRAGLFACSSLGFRPAADELAAAGDLKRRPEPHQVLEPLFFLLEDVVPRRRA
jgi:hypothetical protein